MADNAIQIDFLAAGLTDINGVPLAGYQVRTYASDGITPKAVWNNRAKTSPTANGKSAFSLGTNGTTLAYGDGIYTIKLWAPGADPSTDSPDRIYNSVEYAVSGTTTTTTTTTETTESTSSGAGLVEGSLSTSSYDSALFDLSGQLTTPTGVFFKSDGTQMYVIGSTADSIYQYSLSTAWSVASLSYDSVSLDVSTQEDNPQDLFFRADGTKLYVVGQNSDKVHQYTLSTPWDLSSASYDSIYKDVSSQETLPTGLFFKTDGAKMYIVGTNSDAVYEYDLSVAWDISTANYNAISLNVSDQTGIPESISWSSDGTILYVVSSEAAAHIYQYTASTPWALNSTAYSNVSFDVSGVETTPTGAYFRTSGDGFFLVGTDSVNVYQFSLSDPASIRTDLDVYSKSETDALIDDLSGVTDSAGARSNLDVYSTGEVDEIAEPSITTSEWDISTTSYDSNSVDLTDSVYGNIIQARAIYIRPDGKKLYLVDIDTTKVHQYSLGTAWDIGSLSDDSVNFDISGQESSPYALFFKDDGTKMYIGGSNAVAYQYTLSSAWDVSTASYDSITLNIETDGIRAFFFKPDGSKLYMLGATNTRVYPYNLSVNWDLSSGSYVGSNTNVGDEDDGATGLFFKNDGTKMYMVGANTAQVHQYTLSTLWDITSVSYDSITYDISGQTSYPSGLFFGPEGNRMYVVSSDYDGSNWHCDIWQYPVGTKRTARYLQPDGGWLIYPDVDGSNPTIRQWKEGGVVGAGGQRTVEWPFEFPNAVLDFGVSTKASTVTEYNDAIFHIIGDPTTTGITVQLQIVDDNYDSGTSAAFYPRVWAIGY